MKFSEINQKTNESSNWVKFSQITPQYSQTKSVDIEKLLEQRINEVMPEYENYLKYDTYVQKNVRDLSAGKVLGDEIRNIVNPKDSPLNVTADYKVNDKWDLEAKATLIGLFKKSPSEAIKFAESYNTALKNNALYEYGKEHPVLAGAGSVITNLGNLAEAPLNIVDYLRKKSAGDENAVLRRSQSADITGNLRSGGASNETISSLKIGDWNLGGFVYQNLLNLADIVVSSIATGGISNAVTGKLAGKVPKLIERFASNLAGGSVLGISAAASATNDVLDRGGTSEQALGTGTAAYFFETLFETLSLSELKGFKETGAGLLKKAFKKGGNVKVIGEIAKNMARSLGVNASEEFLTEVSNYAYDYLVNADISQFATSVENYMADDMTEEQARQQAAKDFGVQLAEAAASGAFIGLLGGVGNAVSSYRDARSQLKAEGEIATEDNGKLNTNVVTNPIESYPAEKQNTIKSFINSVDGRIKNFVESVKGGDLTFRRVKISDVSSRAANDIKNLLGIDVSGYTHNINTNGIQHILKRHGENGEANTTMSADEDIARVGWVLDNYDSVELLTDNENQVVSGEFRDKNDRPASQIRYIKKINGTYYVVEAACENKYEKIWVQSAYLTNNKEDVTQVPDAENVTPEMTAETALASPSSNNRISQNKSVVNNKSMQLNKENSEAYNLGVQDIDSADNNGYNNGVENVGGGANVIHQQRGMEEGTGERRTVDSGREGETRRTWQENEETFTSRNERNQAETGQTKRILLKHGNAQMAYTPVDADNSTNGGRAVALLRGIGIEAHLAEGDMESNQNGVTISHSQAFTAPDGKVYISSKATRTDVEIAAHEAVHVNDILGAEAYIKYQAVIKDNIRWNSESYKSLSSTINKAYYNGKADIYSDSFAAKFIREVAAYVNQFVVTDYDFATQQFAELFYDWNAVVEASRQFNKDIGADFSESANFMPENSDLQSTAAEDIFGLSAANPQYNPIEDLHYKSVGVERLTADQKKLKKVGEQFGAKVLFADLDEIRIDPKTGKEFLFSPEGQFDPDTNTITLNTNVKEYHRPAEYILKHELTHSLEIDADNYALFATQVLRSEAFTEYVRSKGYESADAWAAEIIKQYSGKGVKGYQGPKAQLLANQEMVANFVGDMLFGGRTDITEKLLNSMTATERKGFIAIIKEFFAKLKELFKGTAELTEIEHLENLFLETANKVAANNKTATKGSGDIVYSGDNKLQKDKEYSFAMYDDASVIEQAEQLERELEAQGNMSEAEIRDAIWKEYEIVRDTDGIWIYEINDDGMKFYPNGDYLIKDDPDYKEYMALKRMSDWTEAQADRFAELDDKFLLKYDFEVPILKNYLQHDELYEKYPQLKEAKFIFQNLPKKEGGFYDPETNTIVLNERLKSGSEFSMNIAILHEIQHAIQKIEGREKGASEEYWNARLLRGGRLPINPETGKEYTPFEAYEQTIGEIEARNASYRSVFPKEWRRRHTPQLGWENSLSAREPVLAGEYDAEYSSAIENGNIQKAQQMVDTAAELFGYTERLYHQTDADFTEFNTNNQKAGKYDWELPTGTFLKPTNDDIGLSGKKQMQLYANIKKPLEFGNRYEAQKYWSENIPGYDTAISEVLSIDAKYRSRVDAAVDAIQHYSKEWRQKHPNESRRAIYNDAEYQRLSDNQADIIEEWESVSNKASLKAKKLIDSYIAKSDYDGIIVEHDKDGENRETKSYIVFSSAQLKSAAPVTYDDSGNVISLSQRFNENQSDIRYSIPEINNSVENYTEEQYNNFGWVRYNDVLTPSEYSTLLSRYADYKHNKDKYPTTRFGEAVIHSTECPNVIMYIKGNIGNPHITKIIEIIADDNEDISVINERIIKNEYKQKSLPYQTITSMYGEEYLRFHRGKDYASFRQYRAEQEGVNSQNGNSFSAKQQYRAGSIAESEEFNSVGEKGLRYSIPDENNDTEFYSEDDYNNFGWVRYNDVLTPSEYSTLLSRYADYKYNKDKYPTTRFGEAVIHSTECPNVIMYVKGNIGNPQITKIVKIKTDNSDISTIKEWILENEREQISQPYRAITTYYEEEVLSISRKRDYASFRQYRAEQEGRYSQGSNSFSAKQQYRAGSTAESEGINKVRTNGLKYSIPEPDISKDMRSEAERISELVDGKINAKNVARQEVRELGKALGWRVLYGDVYAKDKNGNLIYVKGQDGNLVPKRTEAKVDKTNKTITIDYQNKYPIKTIVKHELTHFLEINSKTYSSFAKKVFNSDIFQEWLSGEGVSDIEEYRDSIISQYIGTKGFETIEAAEISADFEIVARFVADNLFNNDRETMQRIAEMMNYSQRSKFYEFICSIFEKLKEFFKGKDGYAEVVALEREWFKAYQAANSVWESEFDDKISKSTYSSLEAHFINKIISKLNDMKADSGESAFSMPFDEEYFIAKQRDISVIEKAEVMEKRLANKGLNDFDIACEVWLKYGVVRDHKGEWVYELNDWDLHIDKRGRLRGNTVKKNLTLPDYVDLPRLYERYPELDEVMVDFERNLQKNEGTPAYYQSIGRLRRIVIDRALLDNGNELQYAFIHEIQHALQDIDGRASGSSKDFWELYLDMFLPSDMPVNKELTSENYEETVKKYELYTNEMPKSVVSDVRRFWKAYEANDTERVNSILEKVKKGGNFEDFKTYSFWYYKYNKLLKDGINVLTPFEAYMNTAGEIEARMVERRYREAHEKAGTEFLQRALDGEKFENPRAVLDELIKRDRGVPIYRPDITIFQEEFSQKLLEAKRRKREIEQGKAKERELATTGNKSNYSGVAKDEKERYNKERIMRNTDTSRPDKSDKTEPDKPKANKTKPDNAKTEKSKEKGATDDEVLEALLEGLGVKQERAVLNTSGYGELARPYPEEIVPENVRDYLSRLQNYGDTISVQSAPSFEEISLMSRQSGTEFASITIGNKHYIIKGDKKGTPISNELLNEMKKYKGVLNCHSHPYVGDLRVSQADIEFANEISWQEMFLIITPDMRKTIYSKKGLIAVEDIALKMTVDDINKITEIFGG